MAARLKERYDKEIKPQLIERFGYSSPMQTPKLEKITLNMGVGEAKLNTSLLDSAAEQLGVIAGQKPAVRRARKSIANFKLRQGMPVGVKVTLRGERMWEMLDRLQSIAIPRVRDFRGLSPRSFDGRGNYSLGVREQIIFPEIDLDKVEKVRGLTVCINTTARTDAEGKAQVEVKVPDNLTRSRVIVVAVSGGKDSLTTLYLLNKIFGKSNERVAVMVDEGIYGYRDKAIEIAKKNCEEWGVKYD